MPDMDWNARYLEQDTPWDKGTATPVLDEIIARRPEIFAGQQVLVPGCGAGHDARWLAANGAIVTGLDIAPLAVVQARALDPGHTVNFAVGDFLNPSPDLDGAFNLLWEHTCFCALDPSLRPAYLEAAHQVLAPGGMVIGVFFINPEMDEGETGPPFGIDAKKLEANWKTAGFELVDSWVPAAGFDGRIGRERVMFLKKQG